MSETQPQPAPVKSVSRLPENYWQQMMAAPWRYDLFQMLRRLDAQGGERYRLGRALSRCASASSRRWPLRRQRSPR